MNSYGLFIILIAVVVLVLGVIAIKDWKGFTQHEKFKNVPGGIIMALSLAAIVGFFMWSANSKAEGTYFNYLEMFVGIDYDYKNQIFCQKPAPDIVSDDKLTSNVGFRGNMYRSEDKKFEFNLKYQHHSCAYNQDRPTYDAAGIEFTYRIGQ